LWCFTPVDQRKVLPRKNFTTSLEKIAEEDALPDEVPLVRKLHVPQVVNPHRRQSRRAQDRREGATNVLLVDSASRSCS
jgi:hypothetical protein